MSLKRKVMRSNFQSLKLIHRGLAKKNFKENTLNAFRYCFKKKYGIETDLHTTRDNEIICFHDFSLKKFKSSKLIKNTNYNEIKLISGTFNVDIPKLIDLIKISKRKFLMLEIKSNFSKKNLINLVKLTKKLKKFCITSFNEKNIKNIYKINKNLNLGIIFSSSTSIKKIIKKSKLKYLKILVLEKKFINNKTINKLNKSLYFYTIKDKEVRDKHSNKNLIFENL